MKVNEAVNIQAGAEVRCSGKPRYFITEVFDHGDGEIEFAVVARFNFADVKSVEPEKLAN